MLITLLFLLLNIYLLNKTSDGKRKTLWSLAFLVYVIISGIDYYWLVEVEGRPFHLSDPTVYYTSVVNKTFSDVINIESTNSFYLILNWIYSEFWGDPYLYSIFVKLNNILIYLFIYLLICPKGRKVNYLDYIILFNPYILLTMNRNVRDIYIILFVLLILMGLGIYKGAIKIPKPILILSILLLGITRAVLLPLIGFVLFLKYRHQISRFKRVILDIFFISIALYFLPKILFSATRQFVSAAEFSGEKINEYLPLLHGDISFSTILPYIKRISIGFVSFLFTPHPINYINKFITTSDELGRMTIYTGLDNALIIAGSIFTYLFVVPLIFFIIDHRKDVDKLVFIFGLLFGILYALAYLGISDIRNKVAVIFFILISLYNTNLKIKLTKKYYLYTFILLLGIYLVSN